MRNGKGPAKGVQKEVWVYIFDKRTPNSFFGTEDYRRKKLIPIKPDFVAVGNKHHCGKEIARRCFKLGFSTVKDFFSYGREASFAEANLQADLMQKKMVSLKEKMAEGLQSELK